MMKKFICILKEAIQNVIEIAVMEGCFLYFIVYAGLYYLHCLVTGGLCYWKIREG